MTQAVFSRSRDFDLDFYLNYYSEVENSYKVTFSPTKFHKQKT
jgi:hypothetical protein